MRLWFTVTLEEVNTVEECQVPSARERTFLYLGLLG